MPSNHGHASKDSASPDDDTVSDDALDDSEAGDDSQDDDSFMDDTGDDTSSDDTLDDDTGDDSEPDDSADDDTNPLLCVPPGGGPRSPLMAGLAVGDLYAPIGTSMGGYGSRAGPKHPYAVMMGGSTGYIDRPNVKVLTLDNGQDRVVIARIADAASTDVLFRMVLSRVCELSGVDLTGKLWLSATHTHSGPAHSLPIPIVLGGAGMDTFDQGFTLRMADSIAQVVISSMSNLEPAAFAATVVTPFDPDNTFFNDRRCNNDPPPYKEDRLFMARIDRADGSNLAALVSFPDHGAWMCKTVMSADIPGAIENGLQKTFDHPVEALFLQGPAGDVNPAGTPHQHQDEQGMEWHSRTIGPVLRSVFDSLTPVTDLALGTATRPIHASRQEIGYQPGEFGYYEEFTHQFHEYEDGAFFCGDTGTFATIPYFEQHGSIVDCNNPDTHLVDGYYGCLAPLLFVDAWWSWALNPTDVGSIRLGDYLLALIPGELTSFLSKRLRENLNIATGVPDDHLATFGYSNGFQGYLLTEWDWLQGGYETSMNYWGPKYGDYLVDKDVELAQTLYSPDGPVYYPEPALPHFPWPDLLPTGFETGTSAGTVQSQVNATTKRFETVSFSWAGGFTGVGSPHVSFEKDSGDGFEQVILSDGRPLTDAGMETVLTYEPVPGYDTLRFPAQRLHRYTIIWELTADAPFGRYRIRVDGNNWDGNQVVPFEVTSDVFEIAPSADLLVQDLTVTDLGSGQYRISCDGYWPPNPNGYRIRSLDFGPNDWSLITGGQAVATIRVENGTDEMLTLVPTSVGHFEGVFTMTQFGLSHKAEILSGDLQDSFGNMNGADTDEIAFP